tara:strand:+ start:92 stop:1063 length:972 start_codon:yes stop_codon:yes gene_type:complete
LLKETTLRVYLDKAGKDVRNSHMNVYVPTAESTRLADNPRIMDYIALLKPRVMSLVVFTGLCGMLVAPGSIHPFLAVVAIIALAFGAGAAGAINMWFDRDIDAIMTRTATRPIPAGKVKAEEALAFAIIISLFSVMIMGLAVNWVAAGLLAFANFFYSVIYTMWLKRATPQNIVIGGASGAFPPMIGWAAVTGDITLMPVLLFLIIFFWTPPHFWALALMASKDYEKAGVPMLPVTHGHDHTKAQMLIYSLILMSLVLFPFFTGMAGMIYGTTAILCSAVFLLQSITVMARGEIKDCKQMFAFSIFYLFAIFASLVIDHFIAL